MPQLVEEAGGELSAGHTSKLARLFQVYSGETVLADRCVQWQWTRSGVTVTHDSVNALAAPVVYFVPFVFTRLPSGGLRQWWQCPGCERRSDSLYLTTEADRLQCRRCCRLTYRSQQSAKPVTARKERPALWSDRTTERWEYCPVALRLRLVARRRIRRRL